MSSYFSISISIAIFLIFGYTLLHHSLNAPSFDDYDATLNFIKRFYFESQSVSEKLEILFARHNEHRILFSRMVSAAYYFIFREINFAHLVVFQNVFLVAFFGIIVLLFKQERQLNSIIFLILTALLFSFSFWQVSFYYWAGIQHYLVFLFSFSSLIVLNKTEKVLSLKFLLAILLSGMAVFSFGNGFLVLLMGIFLLFSQKKFPLLSAWAIISVALLLITFWGHKQTYSESNISFNPLWMGRLLFTFLGSFLYVNPPLGQYINIFLCMATGLAVLGFWIWLFFSGYAFRNPLLYTLFSLPILTGIMIAISRFETKSAGGIAPRYMFFTATMAVMLLLILLDLKILKKGHLQYLAGVVISVWSLSFYNNFIALKSSNEEIISTVQKWKIDNNTRLVYYREPEEYTEILNWALNHQVVNDRIYRAHAENSIE